ncbi:glycosyltransferase family 2 protein [Porphyromonas gingivalis]|uniref:Glycosyltransferase 2-like domain-containing protein n=2 Tax=Porphyromonas gingivalis TaxID=837 RepID=S5RFY1_PORGN|nr:glycosyltransferase family 2 protein [Porphyromonas gingivalis]AGS13683.1 hypothetical protein [Porphyromonas gingivalis]ATS02450.1 glycosyltransferase family 2 protein [Porphyromonas gingivalis]EOA10161.1 glycosyltransferase, group 2 family protein [Porphyromonas gingivalis JCVI SC001]MCE8192995.1 glycosyltransferase family 2 protein [Porphyromonas gingivalis]
MESRLKVSVIIPTYKPREYLLECLFSLDRQTMPFPDFEVILVLNGELEPYQSWIEQAIQELKQGFPIIFLKTSLSGVSLARNLALDVARGEYICFVDDDDYISDTYLEDLYSIAKPSIVPLCNPIAFSDNLKIDDNYRITRVYNRLKGFSLLPFYKARKYFSGPCMKLIHKDIIGDRRFDTRFSIGEDSLFMFLISDRFCFVSFSQERAIYYRRVRDGSASTRPRNFREKVKNALRIMRVECLVVIRSPWSYNYYFLLTRLLGAVKTVLYA